MLLGAMSWNNNLYYLNMGFFYFFFPFRHTTAVALEKAMLGRQSVQTKYS